MISKSFLALILVMSASTVYAETAQVVRGAQITKVENCAVTTGFLGAELAYRGKGDKQDTDLQLAGTFKHFQVGDADDLCKVLQDLKNKKTTVDLLLDEAHEGPLLRVIIVGGQAHIIDLPM